MRLNVKNNTIRLEGESSKDLPSKVLFIAVELLKKKNQNGLNILFKLGYINHYDELLLVKFINLLNRQSAAGKQIIVKWIMTKEDEERDFVYQLLDESEFPFEIKYKYTHRILFVDPNPLVREILSLHFQKSDFDIRAVSNGKEAYDLLQKNQFDVVVTELNLNYFSGWEILSLWNSEYIIDKPIIILSDSYSIKEAKKSIDKKNIYYIEKPFDPCQLEEYLQRILTPGTYGYMAA